MLTQGLYATPRIVTSLEECVFYHAMDIPGHGTVHGDWDLRGGVDEYLGGVNLRGKRVLEVGTASGFLCFEMEKRGADVVAYDLCEDFAGDAIPYARSEIRLLREGFKAAIRKVNNGYWLGHRAHHSRAQVVYGTAYAIPEEIGLVDVATFGCILLHLHNPFLALANALRLTRETAIVTQPMHDRPWEQLLLGRDEVPWDRLYPERAQARQETNPPAPPPKRGFLSVLKAKLLGRPAVAPPPAAPVAAPASLENVPCMVFMPDFRSCQPGDTWWFLTPAAVRQFLAVLGFEDTTITYHRQTYAGRKVPLYTVVGRRTRALEKVADDQVGHLLLPSLVPGTTISRRAG